MSNETKKEGIKLLHKPAKGKMGALVIVFIWIAIWNVIYQALHGLWAESEIQIVNWAFFVTVTLFFMQEELTYKQRFWHTLVGGAVGLGIAAVIGKVCVSMMTGGMSYLVSISIPLVIGIGLLILLNPYFPMIFNNVGFVYLIIAFIQSDKLEALLPSYLISLLLGSIILNLGCSLLINTYTKVLTKKTIEKAKKQAQAKAEAK